LEKAFWADAERLAGSQLSTKKLPPIEANLGKTAQEAEAGRATKQGADTPKSAEAGVALEFRLAEAEPAAHLLEATVVGTARKVYLHKEQGLTNNDIAEARVTLDQWMKPTIFIRLTEDGRNKMAELTDHKGKLLAILVDGKVISISTIWSKVSSSESQFAVGTKAEAERIATGLNKK
jgi:preprotein translocase subunit SecD